jgi:hypothetical protein
MSKKDDASVRLWLFAAVAFFGLVILYFMGGKLFARRAASAQAPARPAEDYASEPAASPLPTSPIRMKIKRIEPRKYRREGETPPPSPVR